MRKSATKTIDAHDPVSGPIRPVRFGSARRPYGSGAIGLDERHRMLRARVDEAEAAHAEAEAGRARLQDAVRYRELVDHLKVPIVTFDVAGLVTSINRAGERITGYNLRDLPALRIETLIAPTTLGLVRRGRRLRLRAGGYRSRVEGELMTRDGRRLPVDAAAWPLHEGGVLVGYQAYLDDMSRRRQAESALRHLSLTAEARTRRIARALHDESGQLLATLYLRVEEIAAELPPPHRERVRALRAQLDQVYDQLRRLSHELRPSALDEQGLIPACRFLAAGVARRARVQVTVDGSTGGRLPAHIETTAYRVVQEALTNVVKHARATRVQVIFDRVDGVFTGRIDDDGVAFDVARVASRRSGRGIGLVGMREHLLGVGGQLDIISIPGHGTSIRFAVPLEE